MPDKEDLSFFDRILTSNRTALDTLLVGGAIRKSGIPARLPTEGSDNLPSLKSTDEKHANGSIGQNEQPSHQSKPASGSPARLNAKSGSLSFSFRSG